MGECIEWRGAKTGFGYGKRKINGKSLMTHRLAWERANGPIPNGMCVLHRCDNPPCINPDHLFIGTHGDNNRDCYQKGRRRIASKPAVTEQTAVRLKMLKGVISQQSLHKALGVSQSYIKNIMDGVRFAHVTANTRYGF